MSDWPFYTDKTQIRQPTDGLVREATPDRVRNALVTFLRTRNTFRTGEMWRWVVAILDWNPDLPREHSTDRYNHNGLISAIENVGWADSLDLWTAIYYYVRDESTYGLFTGDNFRNLLNSRLLRHYSAYQMDETGLMVEPGVAPATQVIAEARALLADQGFKGPDRQFQGALEAFYQRPNPNLEVAVSAAINAVEGVARIVLDDGNILLSTAMKRIRDERNLHPALCDSAVKLYGYASDGGGRHGLVGDPNVDGPIAEFYLHQCAAAIVFIARLYSVELIEGPGAATAS